MRFSALLISLLSALSSTGIAQTSSPPTAPPGCNTPESHQWDFWIGQWEVHPSGANKIIAHSVIEKKYAGCAVRENWMPVGREVTGGGGSLSIYDPRLKEWRQTWMDSSGSRVQLDGRFADGVMTIVGTWPNFVSPGHDALVRMRYQREPDGEVRQWGDSSVDGGKTWKPSFDFLYRHVDALPEFK